MFMIKNHVKVFKLHSYGSRSVPQRRDYTQTKACEIPRFLSMVSLTGCDRLGCARRAQNLDKIKKF